MNWMYATVGLTFIYIIGNFIFSIWITIGGWFDLVALLRDLKSEQIDQDDNGRVVP
jgi:hypothetical protein